MADRSGSTPTSLSARDGTALFHRRWAMAGVPRAQLLIVHGLKDHSGRYEGFASALAAQGWCVDAFDLRGHGRSGGARQRVRRFTDYVDDLEVELADIRRDSHGVPLFLFGHSLGGAIVARTLLERQPSVAGAVLSAAALKIPASVSSGAIGFTRFLSALFPGAHVLRLPSTEFCRDPSVVREMDADPLIDRRAVPARTAAEILATIEILQTSLEKFRMPLLALHGTADRVTNPEGSAELVTRAASPDKTLKRYDGFYHDLLHEPGSVGADVSDWLNHRV